MLVQQEVLYSNFINSLKSPETKKNYSYALKKYMGFHSMTKYSDLMLADREDKIKQYVIHLSNKAVSKSWFMVLFSSLKNFYEMNDVEDIKWKKLKRYVGEEQPKHEDRRYMDEEIHKLVQNANLKLKATILLMASSGVRIGAVPLLLKGHSLKGKCNEVTADKRIEIETALEDIEGFIDDVDSSEEAIEDQIREVLSEHVNIQSLVTKVEELKEKLNQDEIL